VLYLPNYEPEPQMPQARQMGIDAAFLGSDGWDTDDLTADYPEADGAFLSHHWHPDISNEQSQAFEVYRQVYENLPGNTAALTYNAFGLLFQAIRSQGGADPESIREGLYCMSPYAGVSGIIEYRDNGDPVRSAVILQIKDSEVVFYEQTNSQSL
jgi:branched-chain amino acid transport system substrate-binding protein